MQLITAFSLVLTNDINLIYDQNPRLEEGIFNQLKVKVTYLFKSKN